MQHQHGDRRRAVGRRTGVARDGRAAGGGLEQADPQRIGGRRIRRCKLGSAGAEFCAQPPEQGTRRVQRPADQGRCQARPPACCQRQRGPWARQARVAQADLLRCRSANAEQVQPEPGRGGGKARDRLTPGRRQRDRRGGIGPSLDDDLRDAGGAPLGQAQPEPAPGPGRRRRKGGGQRTVRAGEQRQTRAGRGRVRGWRRARPTRGPTRRRVGPGRPARAGGRGRRRARSEGGGRGRTRGAQACGHAPSVGRRR